jgi:DNA repair protein RadA/Sms
VSRIEQRVQEAAKLGFERVILPTNNLGGWNAPNGVELIGVSSVSEALKATLGS